MTKKIYLDVLIVLLDNKIDKNVFTKKMFDCY